MYCGLMQLKDKMGAECGTVVLFLVSFLVFAWPHKGIFGFGLHVRRGQLRLTK